MCDQLFEKGTNMSLFRVLVNSGASLLNMVFGLLPLQKKIVANSFYGKKYGDNPQYIIEKVHEMDPSIDIVWLKKEGYDYCLPSWIRLVSYDNRLRVFYEYATAKVWVDSHHVNQLIRKRKKQVYIETWHGGLGIKKIELDAPNMQRSNYVRKMIQHTADSADLFLSNSDFLTAVYRSAFQYQGKIWKCGYPKTDILLNCDRIKMKKNVQEFFGISSNTKVILYAPTFREWISDPDQIMELYSFDYEAVIREFQKNFQEECVLLVRLHPNITSIRGIQIPVSDKVFDATKYSDMQELIISCDTLITDYSSCIFDAAVLNIPGFIYATDFDDYKEKRGTYYDLDQLPFPYAYSSKELIENIREFDLASYMEKWEEFKTKEVGLFEPGNASENVARVIIECVNGNEEILERL